MDKIFRKNMANNGTKDIDGFDDISDDFFDDFDDDFFDKVVEMATPSIIIPHVEDNDSLLAAEIEKLSKSIESRKRKLRELVLADDRREVRRPQRSRSKSPIYAAIHGKTSNGQTSQSVKKSDIDFVDTSKRVLSEHEFFVETSKQFFKKDHDKEIVDSSYFIRRRFIDPQLQEIVNKINEGLKIMIIMRGAPGSGKTYLAREILDETTDEMNYRNHIFSPNDYFYDKYGRFEFNLSQVLDSHKWNISRVDRSTFHGWSPIIIDHTNIKACEMHKYLKIGIRRGYLMEIVEPRTPWSVSVKKLAEKNLHNVPEKKIGRMLSNYEPITVKNAMKRFEISYTVPMPQYRNLPKLNKEHI